MQLYHHFGSRFLIDSLNSQGFCCSYNEVHHFEESAAITQGTDVTGEMKDDAFLQYVADNADHYIQTLVAREHSLESV